MALRQPITVSLNQSQVALSKLFQFVIRELNLSPVICVRLMLQVKRRCGVYDGGIVGKFGTSSEVISQSSRRLANSTICGVNQL